MASRKPDMEAGRIRVRGTASDAGMVGDDLTVELVDPAGKVTPLPAMALELACRGHNDRVIATIWLPVSNIDLEVDGYAHTEVKYVFTSLGIDDGAATTTKA